MIVSTCIGVMIGMFIGRFFRGDTNCPRVVLGYRCQRSRTIDCDHRKSVLYTNMATVAKEAEQAKLLAARKKRNLWKGDD